MKNAALRPLIWVLVLAGLSSTSGAVAAPQGLGTEGTGIVDESVRILLPNNVHPLARPQFDVGRSDPALAMDRMILSLTLRPGAQGELDRLLADQLTPGSADYHRWLTPQEFGERFGPSDADVQVVTEWLTVHGFRVEEVAKGRRWINFSGTAAAVEAAFATQIHEYRVDDRLYHANASDPSVPRGLARVVEGIASLNNFPRAKQSRSRRLSPVKVAATAAPGGVTPNFNFFNEGHFLGPADFATIYNLIPSYTAGVTGAGQTVAIVGRTDIYMADVTAFRSFFGLPTKNPVIIHNGPAPGVNGDQDEADLDVEWSGVVAPEATIKFVVSKSTNTTDGVDLSAQYIVDHDLAPVMSTSYGLCELGLGSGGLTFYNDLWAQAAAQGITSFVSSGDSGAAGCDAASAAAATHSAGVNGLASSPFNVAVGGTQFDEGGNDATYWSPPGTGQFDGDEALSYIPEVAWNESGLNSCDTCGQLWSSGGGASNTFAKPSWQSAPGVPADGKRDLPDVSLTAAAHDGYVVFGENGFAFIVSGTSAASPSFAGLMALIVQKTGVRQGNANPIFYQLGTDQYGASGPAIFHDVTSGDNSVPGLTGFSTGTGYDRVTGLGSVDGTALISAFVPFSPSLSVSSPSVVEGNSGTTLLPFTVTLSPVAGAPVTVHYATSSGTATAGSDYVAASGTLTFSPGETTKTIDVTVNGDTAYEHDETLLMTLTLPVNAGIDTGVGTGTILNDEPVPSLSIGDVSVAEGDTGVKSAVFTVTLSGPSTLPTTVQYATANGTATAGSDYTAVSGMLTFPAGTVSKTISVPVMGDSTFEPNETLDVVLSSPVNATIAQGTGVGTILNDDGAGTFQFSAPTYSVSEATPSATITVTRVNGKQGGATVDYTTADGTAKASQPDYTFSHGTLTFAANQFSLTFKVPIVNDSIHEGNETVLLSLSNPVGPGAALGVQSTAVLTITDNDIAPTIQFAKATYSVAEKAGLVKLTVRRAGALTTQGVSFHYATSPGTATGGGTDYGDASGNLTFAASGAGATTQTISVPITQDTVGEGPETFTVTLSAPVNGVLGPLATATVTIVDDDALVGFSAPTFTVNEATSKATITVKRTGSLLGTLTVHYATSNGTATPPRYTATSGDLTFNPKVASQSFPVAIVNDSIDEGTQTVNLTLSAPTWNLGTAIIVGANPAVLSITDNETTVQYGAAAYSVGEAVKSVTISVKRTGSLAGTTTVHYATSDGTATSTGPTPDYASAAGDLTFASGQAAKTFPITLYPDTIADGSQTINLALSAPSGAALGTPSTAVVTIKDNDIAGKVQFAATDYSVSEGEGSVTITVTRTGGTASDATVDYATANDTGIAGTDYTTSSGTLTFGLNEKTKTFTVPILDDGVANSGIVKDVLITLGTPGNGLSLGVPSSATLWIIKE